MYLWGSFLLVVANHILGLSNTRLGLGSGSPLQCRRHRMRFRLSVRRPPAQPTALARSLFFQQRGAGRRRRSARARLRQFRRGTCCARRCRRSVQQSVVVWWPCVRGSLRIFELPCGSV